MRLLGQPRKKVKRQLAGRELLRIDGDFVPVTLRLNPRARRLISMCATMFFAHPTFRRTGAMSWRFTEKMLAMSSP